MKECCLAMVIEQDTRLRQLVWVKNNPIKIHLLQKKNYVFLTKYVGTFITLQEDLHSGICAIYMYKV